MNWLDILILVFAGIAAFGGWAVGLVRVALSLVGIVVAIVLARNYFPDAAQVFSGIIDNANAENFLGFVVIFLLVLVVTAVLSTLLNKMLGALMLGWANRMGGLLLGAFLAFCLVSVMLSVVNSFPILDLETTISESSLGLFLLEEFDVVLQAPNLLPDDLTSELPGI